MNDSINDLDRKINDIKSELDRLSKATELIPTLESDLKTLESAKLILGTNGSNRIETPFARKRTRPTNTIGALTIKILNEVGTPLHAKEIVAKLSEKGKKANNLTVTGACLRLQREGILKKTYPNTFDLVSRN